MTLDFYVRILGMPLVHGLRTPARPARCRAGHGMGVPPYPKIAHFFLDMGGDSLLAFFEYPKGVAARSTATPSARCSTSRSCAGRSAIERSWSG